MYDSTLAYNFTRSLFCMVLLYCIIFHPCFSALELHNITKNIWGRQHKSSIFGVLSADPGRLTRKQTRVYARFSVTCTPLIKTPQSCIDLT